MIEKVEKTLSINAEIKLELMEFLHYEAQLLDHREYWEWLELLDDELVYLMPARITNEGRHNDPNIDYESKYFEDTKKSLMIRIKRLDGESAWAEYTSPRQRHFISNILVKNCVVFEDYEEYHVSSYFLFKRNRGSSINCEEIFGEREDVIRRKNGEWKIVSRTIYPDQSVLVSKNLSMFL
jgi:3-phenylpropionate/cinnamic acid dioxygenase small subunit